MRQVVSFQRIEKFKSSSYVPCIAIHENSCLCVRLLHFLQFVVSTRFSYTIHYSLSSNLYCLIMLSLHHITISSIHSASLSISCFLPSLPLIFWHPPPPLPLFFQLHLSPHIICRYHFSPSPPCQLSPCHLPMSFTYIIPITLSLYDWLSGCLSHPLHTSPPPTLSTSTSYYHFLNLSPEVALEGP